jgi:hypothetical protein
MDMAAGMVCGVWCGGSDEDEEEEMDGPLFFAEDERGELWLPAAGRQLGPARNGMWQFS